MAQRTRPELETENQELKKQIARLRQELENTRERLTHELEEARNELNQSRIAMAAMVKPPPSVDGELQGRLLAALVRLSTEDPDEGLVSLPLLRREVVAKKGAVDRALLDLERQGRLTLRSVRHPQLVAAESGIEVAERGLLYYVLLKTTGQTPRHGA